MKYTVIMHRSLSELITAVTEYIKDGWEPLGGVAISHAYRSDLHAYDEVFAQAMIGLRSEALR
jgi:hypothetical protein